MRVALLPLRCESSLFTGAGAYYLALVPMLLVYTHHVGLPFLLERFLVWAPGILALRRSVILSAAQSSVQALDHNLMKRQWSEISDWRPPTNPNSRRERNREAED